MAWSTSSTGFCCRARAAEPDDRVPIVSATLTAGRVVLAGEVADEAQRALLVDGASRVLDPANVDDRLTVAPDAAIDDDTVRSLAELVAVMPPNLVSGESGYDGTALYAEGVFVDNRGARAFLAVADFVSAAVELAPRPTASDDDAEALEDELNAFVVANPIQFAPASADVAPDASAVLDQIAGIAEQFDGVTITIEGHTDSDGVPAENQALSEQRAVTVLAGLVDTRRAGRRPGGRRPRLDAAHPRRRCRGQGCQPPDRVPSDDADREPEMGRTTCPTRW